jgi:peroxiredoxin
VANEPISFTLPAADGSEISLSAISDGQPATVVVFTCNHCPYALAWHGRLQDVARDYAGHIGFVQVNSNDAAKFPEDSFTAMKDRVARGEFATPYVWDESQDVARAWGAEKTPHVFVLDQQGQVVYEGAPDGDYGDESLRARWLREALDDLLAGRAVALPRTMPRGCAIKWR